MSLCIALAATSRGLQGTWSEGAGAQGVVVVSGGVGMPLATSSLGLDGWMGSAGPT